MTVPGLGLYLEGRPAGFLEFPGNGSKFRKREEISGKTALKDKGGVSSDEYFLGPLLPRTVMFIDPGPVSIASASRKDEGVFILIHIQVECNLNYFHNRVNGLLVESAVKGTIFQDLIIKTDVFTICSVQDVSHFSQTCLPEG